MKKMNYGSLKCTISVAENYTLHSQHPCEYGRDTVAYAVERFFVYCKRFCKACTQESWQFRIAKGKTQKSRRFQYLVPAALMELPGNWVQISGTINAIGVTVEKVEILEWIE